LGRTIGYDTDFTTDTDPDYEYYKEYTFTDADGTPRSYTLHFLDNHSVWNPWEEQYEEMDGLLVSIELPDSSSYEFDYDHEQGFLTQVMLPTGGYIRYVYLATETEPENDYVIERYISYDGVSHVARRRLRDSQFRRHRARDGDSHERSQRDDAADGRNRVDGQYRDIRSTGQPASHRDHDHRGSRATSDSYRL
jgi:hypothetical protein